MSTTASVNGGSLAATHPDLASALVIYVGGFVPFGWAQTGGLHPSPDPGRTRG